MAIPTLPCFFVFFFLISATISASPDASDQSQTFIIHMSKSHKPTHFSTHHHWYSSIIKSLPSSSTHPAKILYTYTHSINGFSATLTAEQATSLRRFPFILSVVPDQPRQIHTTRTPHFLGLADTFGLWPNSDYADDVIIAVLDTGIWPEIRSFSDEGLSSVPSSRFM